MKSGDLILGENGTDGLSEDAAAVFRRLADSVQRGFARGLSLSDNIECEVGSANFTHDTPLNYRLKSLPSANSIIPLNANGHLALGCSVSGGQERSVRITYKFLDSSASQVKCWFVLFREGEGARQPTFLPQAWQAPTLLNSWVNFDATTWAPAGYFKDSEGIVHIRGLVKNGTLNSVVFTLPSGYRPPTAMRQVFPAIHGAGGGAVISRIDVEPNGNVTSVDITGNTYLSLSGITFDTR